MPYSPESKQLLAEHPLFKRLTGQVVWTLLEEAGVDPGHIDPFMDRFEALKAETLAQLKTLDEEGGALAIVEAPGAGPVCDGCARLAGHCIPGDVPDPIRLMPPYGLGCRLRARHLQPAELFANTGARLLLDADDLPRHGPLCSRALECGDLAQWPCADDPPA
ncbi:MAG: hypothetical protein ACOCWR_02115 [Oceanidesulfovibrio sp.]